MIFDILLCLAEDVTESAFVEGERSGSYGRYIPVTMKSSEHPKRTLMRNARAMLWQRLRGVELKGGLLTIFFLGGGGAVSHNVKNYRRGTRGNSWWGCAAGFPNPNPISDQKMSFSTPVFRPGL